MNFNAKMSLLGNYTGWLLGGIIGLCLGYDTQVITKTLIAISLFVICLCVTAAIPLSTIKKGH